jgi:hypothetical protein
MSGAARTLAASALLMFSTAALGQSAPPAGSGVEGLPYNGSFLAPNPFGPLHSFNWSDMPFTATASESIGYNTNVLGIAQGTPGVTRGSMGDWYSTTVVGMSVKSNVGAQVFFADGTYGLTRYRQDRFENTSQYSLDAGVNWHLTTRCSGTVIAAINQYQSPLGFQLGSGINLVTSESLNESATCQLSPYVGVLADSGLSATRNAGANGQQNLNSSNDTNTWFARGGLRYTPSSLDTITLSATYTRQFFANLQTIPSPENNLASASDSIAYELQYTRVITPKITFNGSVGLTEYKLQASGPNTTGSSPSYSVGLTWQPFPKLSFSIADSLSVGAPTSVQASLQVTQSASVGAVYQLSPKITLSAGAARSNSSGASASTAGFSTTAPGAGTTTSAYFSASYTISPFWSATASVQHSVSNNEQVGSVQPTGSNGSVQQNIFTVALSYHPH